MPDTVISVGGDIRDLQSKLQKAEKEVDGLKSRLDRKGKSGGSGDMFGELKGLVGGFVGVSAIKGVIDEFDRMGDLAARLDVTAESIQRVNRQAKLSGTDVEVAVASLTKLRKNIEAGGDDKTSQALAAIGVSAEQLLRLEPDQQIILLADAYQEAQAKGTGFAALQDLMGKGFVELLPLLRSSREELAQMAAQPVVSEKTIADLQRFNDGLDSSIMTAKAFTASFLGGLGQIGEAMSESRKNGTALGDELAKIEARDKAFAAERKRATDAQRKADADAATAKAKQANSDAGAKQQIANEKAKAEIAFEALTTAGKLEDVYRRIAEVNQRAEGMRSKDDPLAAAQLEGELIALFKQESDLKKKAADEREREADAAKRVADQSARDAKSQQEKIQRQVQSQRALGDELAILQARAKGREKIADKLEKEAKIKADAKKIADETGLPPAQARAVAEEKQRLEDRIEGRKNGKIYGARASSGFAGLASREKPELAPLTFDFPALRAKDQRDRRDASGRLSQRIGTGAATAAQQKADEKKERAQEGPALLESVLKEIADNTKRLRDLD